MIPIIDSHIHLFDPTRVQGVPYPSPEQTLLWQPALPARYRALAAPLGITGAVAVEASPWPEDNQWLLEACRQDRIMVAAVGNLEPDAPGFEEELQRLCADPLFRGLRYGNLWDRNLAQAIRNPRFLQGLKAVQRAGLTLDTANPDQELLEAVIRVSDHLPDLRIAIDHLPHAVHQIAQRTLTELGQRPQIHVKVSEVLEKSQTDLEYYRPRLDFIWDTFGEDRLLFGSDWPNWDPVATLAEIVSLAKQYVLPKGPTAAQKFFSGNALALYSRLRPLN